MRDGWKREDFLLLVKSVKGGSQQCEKGKRLGKLGQAGGIPPISKRG